MEKTNTNLETHLVLRKGQLVDYPRSLSERFGYVLSNVINHRDFSTNEISEIAAGFEGKYMQVQETDAKGKQHIPYTAITIPVTSHPKSKPVQIAVLIPSCDNPNKCVRIFATDGIVLEESVDILNEVGYHMSLQRHSHKEDVFEQLRHTLASSKNLTCVAAKIKEYLR
ncbi:MAG: hypothetical protein ABIF10_04755 [Candidatus Woesearchaeota archaeon]